jgi:hypothetical protein
VIGPVAQPDPIKGPEEVEHRWDNSIVLVWLLPYQGRDPAVPGSIPGGPAKNSFANPLLIILWAGVEDEVSQVLRIGSDS